MGDKRVTGADTVLQFEVEREDDRHVVTAIDTKRGFVSLPFGWRELSDAFTYYMSFVLRKADIIPQKE